MKNKIIWLVVAVVLVGGVAWRQSRNNSDTKSDTVKIGAIIPLTGWGAYWGEGYIKGAHLAVDEIRAQGGKIEVVIEDGATEAQKSASAAQKLIAVDGVDALTVEFTGPSSAVSPISAQNKIPLIYNSLVEKFLDENPYSFKMYFDIGKQCTAAAEYLADNGAKKIGGFLLNLDFAPECKVAIEKVAQEKGVASKIYLFNIDVTDFRTMLAKMKNDHVDSIIPVFYEDHSVSFFKQKDVLDFNVPIFTGIGIPDAFTDKVISSVPQRSIEGVITYDQPVDQKIREKLSIKYPAITEKDFVPAVFGYDEVMYLYRAISQCDKSDEKCVVSKMKEDTYVGGLQAAGFGDDRVLNMSPHYYKYTNGKFHEFLLEQ